MPADGVDTRGGELDHGEAMSQDMQHVEGEPARPRESGSSLIELMMMLSCALILIGATLTSTMQHAAQRQINMERLLAFDAARNVLEELRLVEAANLPAMDGTGFDVPGPNGEAGGLVTVAGDADGLVGEILLEPDTTVGSTVLYRARVSVRWRGRDPRGFLSIESLMGGRRR